MLHPLHDLNEDLTDAEASYLEAKSRLKTLEADLWIDNEINWEEELGKSKPTIKDKEMWIKSQIDYVQDDVDEKLVKYHFLQRKYDILMKLEGEASK